MRKPYTLKISPAVLALLLWALPLLAACTSNIAVGEVPETVPTQTLAEPAMPATATATPFQIASLPGTPLSPAGQEVNCTYSAYYWQISPDRWLTDNLVIGRFTYTKEDALLVLGNSRTDSTNLILKEFFAAALNILKGANPGAVEQDMVEASNWLSAHPPGFEISAADSQKGLALAERLHAYNGGELGPALCADEPATPTPTPTATPTVTPTPTVTSVRPTETPVLIQPTRNQPQPGGVAPTQPPPTQAPPTQEPPTQAPPTQAPPTQPPKPPTPTSAPVEPPTEAPPVEPPTEAPPAVISPPTEAPPPPSESAPPPTP